MSLFKRLFRSERQPARRPLIEAQSDRIDIHRGVDVRANSDIISGYRFCATMQLRTPLRVLARHGEVHHGLDWEPPQIAREMWEGIWIPKLRSWRELGIEKNEIPPGTMASDIGPVPADGGQYLQFLIAVRVVAEGDGLIEDRRAAVGEVLTSPAWSKCVRALGGREAILDRLFPPFLTTISRMPVKTAVALMKAGYGSPASIAGAKDSALLAIEGVGMATIAAIRRECPLAAEPQSRFVDRIIR
jgi:hypothetical protein